MDHRNGRLPGFTTPFFAWIMAALSMQRTARVHARASSRFLRSNLPSVSYRPFAFLLFAAIFSDRVFGQQGYSYDFAAMGTSVQLRAIGDDPKAIHDTMVAVEREVHRLEGLLSDYQEDSEVSQITKGETNEWHSVGPELWEVLSKADTWNSHTDGAFDASLGTLTQLWRRARRKHHLPDPSELAEARQHAGWNGIRLDRERHAIQFTRSGIKLDLGGIAKGFIVDRAFELLHARFPKCLIQSGGDMRCGDAPVEHQGWRIALGRLSDEEASPMWTMEIANAAVSSSGDLFQYFELEGKRLSHVLDPKTGEGIPGPMMATVIARTSVDADALASSLCVLGHVRSFELLKSLPGIRGRLSSHVDPDQPVEVTQSDNFPTLSRVQSSSSDVPR